MTSRPEMQAVVAVLVLAGATRFAHASEPNDLIAEGIKLRQEDRDHEALPIFQKALEEQPTPRAFGQLGTCEQALGLWISAEMHLAEALKHPGDLWVQKNQATLHAALVSVQQRLGSVEVWGSPPGARVSIGGEFMAALPMSQPARAVMGQRTITVEAPGFLSETVSVEVRSGALVREHVVLRSIAAPVAQAAVPEAISPLPVAPALVVVPARVAEPQRESTPPSGSRIYQKWWFWAAVGTVAVATVTSILVLSNRNAGCTAPMGGMCTTF